ncbi:hypothetical protein HMI54_014393 [Coelomomyces lativittatus]|nr:hypothetical protein HMI55_002268 [Coelomomyces lativittatus]KAJ1515179.1 hypothetical protein HMI56_006371 [Coelomomyces lativittatus]KAJ1518614.1 hypothetical protein HMI54_014393 [Coelomomyces lativittatus]
MSRMATMTTTSTTTSKASRVLNSEPPTWVPFLLPKHTLLSSPSMLQTVNLPHPKTKEATVFLIQIACENQNQPTTVLAFFALERIHLVTSCFYQDRIVSNGSTLVVIPIDPIFVLLPILESLASKHFISLETILHSTEYTDLATLATLPNLSQKLNGVCDQQCLGDETLFRVSKEKTLHWLSKKWNALATHFDKKKDTLNGTHLPSSKETHQHVLKYISEWVHESWLQALQSHLNLDLVSEHTQDVLSLLLQQSVSSQKKINEPTPSLEPITKKLKKSVSTKPAPLSKTQTTLNSFFKKS